MATSGLKVDNVYNMTYKRDGRFVPLPLWCAFFVALGKEISEYKKQGRKLVIAISVPTRAFCLPMISMGFLLSRFEELENLDNQEQVKNIRSLGIGQPVVFTSKNGRKYKGIYQGVIEGEKYFIIRTDRGNSTERHIEFSRASSIQINEHEGFDLPQNEKTFSLLGVSPLLKTILGTKYAAAYIESTTIELLVIGSLKTIKMELVEQLFSCEGNAGRLLDIVRPRQFLGRRDGYRSYALSEQSLLSEQRSKVIQPSLVVFDGSQSYLKWRSYWGNSNSIYIFDQTESQYYSGVNQVNSEYVQMRLNASLDISLPKIPAGIEIMAFEVEN